MDLAAEKQDELQDLNNKPFTSTESKEKELEEKLKQMEIENRKMQNEFNAQRAKLKELFLQKETEHKICQNEKEILRRELDEMKSQVLVADLKQEGEMRFKDQKAQEEILSLQQLVQDTIEESTTLKADLLKLRDDYKHLWIENNELRSSLQQQDTTNSSSLAPQVLNHMKKTIVRKLGGDIENQEESIRRQTTTNDQGTTYAQEDPEVLRSIVEQLQEEMKALKQKLRETDEKLQANELNSNKVNIETETEIEIENPIEKIAELMKGASLHDSEVNTLKKQLATTQDNLDKEAALRKDLEGQWQEKREIHRIEVQQLSDQVKKQQQQLLDLQQMFLEAKDEMIKQLQRLGDNRERVNKQLETLQADNDFLSGRYLATAEEIENQCINLPDTVEELQELMLKQRNELIQARVSSEYERNKCAASSDERQILRDQLDTCNEERRTIKKQLQTEIKSLQERLSKHLSILQNYETDKKSAERREADLNRQISELRVEIIELQENNVCI